MMRRSDSNAGQGITYVERDSDCCDQYPPHEADTQVAEPEHRLSACEERVRVAFNIIFCYVYRSLHHASGALGFGIASSWWSQPVLQLDDASPMSREHSAHPHALSQASRR